MSETQAVVTVRCVRCKTTRDIGPGEIPKGSYPMCDRCYMPMTPVEARLR